jgi:hypothetical protein
MPGQRPHAGPRERLGEPEPVQHAGRVRADLHAGADLVERGRLLVHLHVEARSQQGERGGQAPDATADDADRAATIAPGHRHRLDRCNHEGSVS